MVGNDGLRRRNRFGCTVEASQEFSATIQRLEVVAVDAVASRRLELGRKASAFEVVRCSEPRTLLRGPVSRASSAMGIELKVRTAVLSCDGGPPWLAQGV